MRLVARRSHWSDEPRTNTGDGDSSSPQTTSDPGDTCGRGPPHTPRSARRALHAQLARLSSPPGPRPHRDLQGNSPRVGMGPVSRSRTGHRHRVPHVVGARLSDGEAPFEAVHVALYCAFFTDGINIGRPEEDLEVVARVPGVDVGRFLSNFEFGRGRQAVLEDYEAPVSRHAVRVIPTLVVPDGRHVIGAVSLSEYRRVLGGVTALWLRFGQDAA